VYNKSKIGYTVVILITISWKVIGKTELTFENEGVLTHMYSERRLNAHVLPRSKHGNFSSIGYCQIHKISVGRSRQPFNVPEFDYEKQGVEDPCVLLK